MSELRVEVTEILKVDIHPNADRLDMVTVFGWQCVTGRGQFKVGDKVVYIPIDSVLSPETQAKLFSPESKIKPDKGRIKTIKIRGVISQGMVASLSDLSLPPELKIGKDVAKELGITKYEPLVRGPQLFQGQQRKKRLTNPFFKKYTDIQNIKYYPKVFDGGDVWITEKIHGSNFRSGQIPFNAFTLWKKILRFFKLSPKHEFVFGSHNVEMTCKTEKQRKKGYYEGKDIYYEMTQKYDLEHKLKPPFEVIYAEIYGDGIQKGYNYGLDAGKHDMRVMDVMVDGKYLNTEDAIKFCEERGLPFVPILYHGLFSMEKATQLVSGPSILCPTQKVREGIVIKADTEQTMFFGRAILKYLNPDYLMLKDNTDWH